jgi:cystatin-C
MKRNWRIVMIIIALNIVLGGMSGVLAQQAPIVGGYAETSKSDPEVVAAARFAVRAESRKQRARISLLSIERAEVQVVAGLNYRLQLRVKVSGKAQDVTAVVYKNLRRKYSLSDWEAGATQADSSGSASSNSTIEQLAKAVAEAYTAESLGSLDAEHPFFGRVKISIENSLGEDTDKDRLVTKEFKTFEKVEQWLKSRARGDNGPSRETMLLRGCKKGVCTYDFGGGILHNHLYLQRIAYGYRTGRPYIKTIFLLDGD